MKKNISINIGGIIFHIEEDGYELLKSYLDAISQYFSSFEESQEIISDIENRIAEIFTSKLNVGKEVITAEDVANLIATMGSVADFAALEEEEDRSHTTTSSASKSNEGEPAPKKLYRDTKHKEIGGVAAGLANFWGVDPLWPRLMFVALFLGLTPFIPAWSGFTFLAYIVLWIVLPENKVQEAVPRYKKLFRDPDSRVVGGVCSGLAAYFGTEIAVFRLIFVLAILLGGSGFVVYIVLWIIMPEAKSITDKMKMQGEPVTLSNIENNIKRALDIKEDREEKPFVKLLLFPFRLVAKVFAALGKFIGPGFTVVGEIFRISLGVLLVLIPLVLLLTLVFAFMVLLGWVSHFDFLSIGHLPLDHLVASFPLLPALGLLFALAIPLLFVGLLGSSILAKRSLIPPVARWSLAGLFVVSLAVVAFSLPPYVYQFKKEATHRTEELFVIGAKTPVLKCSVDDTDDFFDIQHISLKLKGYEGADLKLVSSYEARGRDMKEAQRNAQDIHYRVIQKDSVLTFNPHFTLAKGSVFRAQDVNMVLYVPYGKQIILQDNLEEVLFSHSNRHRSSDDLSEKNTWVMEKEGLKCLTCKDNKQDGFKFNVSRDDQDSDWNIGDNNSGTFKKYAYRDFSGIHASGVFNIHVVQGNDYQLHIRGEEDALEDLDVRVEGDILKIDMEGEDGDNPFDKKIEIDITMPELEELELNGATSSKIKGFHSERLKIALTGLSSSKIDVEAEELEMDISGGSQVKLKGSAEHANISVSGACHLKAYEFKIENGEFEMNGPSVSRIYVTNHLKINANGLCDVRYKGNPTTVEEASNLSKIRREED